MAAVEGRGYEPVDMNIPVLDMWQDNEIRWNVNVDQIQPRKGEYPIVSLNGAEDIRGHPGKPGAILGTNMRFIWWNLANPSQNLSIGYDCIIALALRPGYPSTQLHSSLIKGTEYLFESFGIDMKIPSNQYLEPLEIQIPGFEDESKSLPKTVPGIGPDGMTMFSFGTPWQVPGINELHILAEHDGSTIVLVNDLIQ